MSTSNQDESNYGSRGSDGKYVLETVSSLDTPASFPRKTGEVSSLDLGLRSMIGWLPLVETPPALDITIDNGVRR